MFELDTGDLGEIRKSVRKLAEKELQKYQTDKFYNTVPRQLFSEFANIGLTGLAIDEEYGGLAASPLAALVVMEELAASDLGPAIFTSVHTMVSGIVNRYGSPEQRKRILPKFASGEWLGAFALTEPRAGSDAASLSTTFDRRGSDYVINGEKCYITSAGFAEIYVVFARKPGTEGKAGVSAFIVEAETKGLSISKPEKKMGCELSPIASLNFSDAIVPAENMLATDGSGYGIALSGLAKGRINIAACANGLSRTAINRAIEHLNSREQFGQKLADFQGLQFMLADMRLKLEAAQLLTWNAAKTLTEFPDNQNNRLLPSMAKCFATDAAMSITTDAVQLLGGAGYIREYQVERLMREAKMLQIVEGANQVQRMVIAREILKAG